MTKRAEQELALALATAVRTAAYYEPENAVMRESARVVWALLANQLEAASPVTVGVHSRCVFVQKTRIRSTLATYSRFAFLVELFDSWEIKTLSFFPGLSETELVRLLMVLGRNKGEGAEALAAKLRGAAPHIAVDLPEPGGVALATVAPVRAYASCMQMARDIRTEPEGSRVVSLRQLRRVTQSVVDQVLSDPYSLIALSTIKDFDDYLISHSTNVAILAVVLGQRLGLSKAQLGELCLAAFLHDTGKTEVDPDVLAKPGPLSDLEWQEMRRHPTMGSMMLLASLQPGVPSMRAAVVAFEHHLRYDRCGYPTTTSKRDVTLFGSIVSIADVFDALTTARVYRARNLTPYEALDYLIANAGTRFDPVLVKLFAEVMGLYPSGTVVELTSGEVAVVVKPPPAGGSLDRPHVRILKGTEPGKVVDLGDKVGGHFMRTVKNVVNPHNRGLTPAVVASLLAEEASPEHETALRRRIGELRAADPGADRDYA
jgi:HD-GYP domain-containing protein (c-di-GMP phosphodiesterase class II)